MNKMRSSFFKLCLHIYTFVFGFVFLNINVASAQQPSAPTDNAGYNSIIDAINKLSVTVYNDDMYLGDFLSKGLSFADPKGLAPESTIGVNGLLYSQALQNAALNSVRLDFADSCVLTNNVASLSVGNGGKSCDAGTFDYYYNYIFPKTLASATLNPKANKTALNPFSPESLLGALQYTDPDSAKNYIKYVESSTRGGNSNVDVNNIITDDMISGHKKEFTLDYSPAGDNSSTTLKLHSNEDLSSLKNEILNDADYQSYALQGKTETAQRALNVDMLIAAYLRRLPNQEGGKSQALAEYNAVASRFSSDYINAINSNSASAVVISRQILFTLNEILRQLYEANQYSERMLVLQAVSTMPSASKEESDAKEVYRRIFCKAATDYKATNEKGKAFDTSVCTQSSSDQQSGT